jgi:uncharacterized protein
VHAVRRMWQFFHALEQQMSVSFQTYSNVMEMIPNVESLIGEGLPVGTFFAFLMSVTAVSLPEIIILKKVLKMSLS